jgi:hypothetical protein
MIGFVAFATYAVVALFVGIRTEVFLPLVVVVVMASFRTPVITWRLFLVVLVAGLCLISGIRTLRTSGVADLPGSSSASTALSVNPIDGLAEMGYSLRPTVVVIQWWQEGQQPLDGSSFLNPFIRLAHSTLPILGPNLPAGTDPNILNSVVFARVGPIGFSQIAEAYDNWAASGVVGFLFMIGILLSWIDQSPRRMWSLLVRSSVFVPILLEVRNTFTAVPGQIILGLVAAGAVFLLGRSRGRSRYSSVKINELHAIRRDGVGTGR